MAPAQAARFPAAKGLDTFDFLAIRSMNKALVMELARCEYIERRDKAIAVGNSGTGKTHVALRLGLVACQRHLSVCFSTAAALVHELMEARDERRLLHLQRQLPRLNLLIIDELGFVPLSRTRAELIFEVFIQRYERGSILVYPTCLSTNGSRSSARSAHRRAAVPAHLPRPHPGNERRELQAQVQPGERCLASSRESGRRITHRLRCPFLLL